LNAPSSKARSRAGRYMTGGLMRARRSNCCDTMQAESQYSYNTCLLIKLEFRVGITFSVGLDGKVLSQKFEAHATDEQDNVYVAIRKSDGKCVKIGMTNKSTWGRWKSMINMIDGQRTRSYRSNEVADQKRLRQLCFGQDVEIWHRKAFKLALVAVHGPSVDMQSCYLNEIYLDQLFEPRFGKDLSGRRQ
jgi:hypothetical protein